MMSFIPQESLQQSVLYKLFVHAQTQDTRLKKEDVAKLYSFPVSAKRVELALKTLYQSDDVDYTVQNSSYSITASGYSKTERLISERKSFLHQYYQLGDDWLADQTLAIDGVPAANRVVRRDDNSAAMTAMEQGLEDAVEIIQRDNEVGADLGDEKELLVAEIAASKELVKGNAFRLGKLISLLMPSLRYLADKFSGSAIGELSKQLIVLLLGLR